MHGLRTYTLAVTEVGTLVVCVDIGEIFFDDIF